MNRILCVVLALASACSNLPDLVGLCGNGVIDDGEDCDSSDPAAHCSQCALVCQDPAGGPACRDGYLCGADKLCHAASGVFEQNAVRAFEFPVGRGQVADLDGDRIGDIVGFSDITIDVHFGDPDVRLDAQSSALVPVANGATAIRALESGGSDILLATADGLAAFAAPSHVVLPYPFANDPGDRGNCASMMDTAMPTAFFPLDKRHIGVVATKRVGGAAYFGVIDATSGECSYAAACGMTYTASPTTAFSYDRQVTTSVTPGALSAIVAITVDTQTCVMRMKDVPNGSEIYTIAQVGSVATNGAPSVLARAAPGDACPSLFIGGLAGGIDRAASSSDVLGCKINLGTVTPISGVSLFSAATGHVALQPAIANAGADGLVVFTQTPQGGTSTIYSLAGASASPIYQSARPLITNEVGDLDGDNRLEVIGTSPYFPDIDVLYRATGSMPGFLPYRIPTQSIPLHVVLGDFDGNGLTDIAYTERMNQRERLMIAYGTHDRPLPAVEIATFTGILAISACDIPDSLDPFGLALDDLIILDSAFQRPLLTMLHGNPQRSMLAYYDPRPVGIKSELVGVTTGNFSPASSPLDVIAVERPLTPNNSNGLVEPAYLYYIDGKGGETLADAPPRRDSEIAPDVCNVILRNTGAAPKLCALSAQYLAWPISDAGVIRDVVIAIDEDPFSASRHMATFDPKSGTGTQLLTESPAASSLPGPRLKLHSLFGADIDGVVDADGRRRAELILSFQPYFGTTDLPVVKLCDVTSAGVVTSCKDLAPEVPELRDLTCGAASPGIISARGRLDPAFDASSTDLAVLCESAGTSTLYRVTHSSTGFHATPLVSDVGQAVFFTLGDITGDRVDDLIGITFDFASGIPSIHVYPQCEARNKACRERNSAMSVQ